VAARQTIRAQGSIGQWLREQLFKPRDGQFVSRIDLNNCNIITGAMSEKCDTWEVLDADREEDKVAQLAEKIESAAQDDAVGYTGAQNYAVRLFLPAGRQPCARFWLPIEGLAQGQEGQLLGTERGATVQMQGMVQNLHSRLLGTHDVMAQLIKDQNEELRGYRTEWMQSKITMEQLLSLQHERELNSAKAYARMMEMKEITGTVKQLLPAIVNKWKGDEVIPGAKSPFEVVIDNMVDELANDGDAAMKAAESFSGLNVSEETRAALMLLFQQKMAKAIDKREKKAREDQAANSDNQNGPSWRRANL
jgi:hypothetical protein